MRRHILLSCLLVGLAGLVLAAPPPKGEISSAQTRLSASLKVFDALVMGADKKDVLWQVYQAVRPVLIEGRIQFVVDAKERSLLESVEISGGKDRMMVAFSISLFRQEQKTPGILTGFIAQSVALLHNIIKADSPRYDPDEIQKFYATMDALLYHARFLSDLSAGKDRQLHPLEHYLVNSLENDMAMGITPMATASVMLLQKDAEALRSFAELGGAAKDKTLNFQEYVGKVKSLVQRLQKSVQDTQNLPGSGKMEQEVRYISLVSALTVLSYGSAIVNDHLKRFFPGTRSQADQTLLDELDAQLEQLYQLSVKYKASLAYQKTFLDSIGVK